MIMIVAVPLPQHSAMLGHLLHNTQYEDQDVTRRDFYPKPFRFANYDVLPPKTGIIDIVQKRQQYTQ